MGGDCRGGSAGSDYLVQLHVPACSCEDWLHHHLPCKHMLLVVIAYDSRDMVPAAYQEHPYFTLDKAIREMNPLPECNMSDEPSIPLHASSPVTKLDASLRTINNVVHQECDPKKLLQTSALIAKIIKVLSNESNEDSHHPLPAPFCSSIKQMRKLPFGITSGRKNPL